MDGAGEHGTPSDATQALVKQSRRAKYVPAQL
jgi:hypothetical protein